MERPPIQAIRNNKELETKALVVKCSDIRWWAIGHAISHLDIRTKNHTFAIVKFYNPEFSSIVAKTYRYMFYQ